MSKAKAKADSPEDASSTATAIASAPESSVTPVRKRAVRSKSAPDADIVPAEGLPTLPPALAKATRARKTAAPAAAEATPVAVAAAPVDEAPKPVRATRSRKAAAPAPVTQPELFSIEAAAPAEKPKRAPRAKAPAPVESEATPKPRPAALETPISAPPLASAPVPPSPSPSFQSAAPVASKPPQVDAPPAPRPRKLDPEEEIAEAIAQARQYEAEAKALHAEARAKAAEAKAREAEARLRAAEARARASGADSFDMEGESVIEKAPPMPGQISGHGGGRPDYPNQPRRDRDRDGGGQHNNNQNRGPQGPGSQNRGPQQGGGGNKPQTVYQGHGGPGAQGGKSKRDKFEWKKNKNNRNKPWEKRNPDQQGPRPGGGAHPTPQAEAGAEGDSWRPGEDDLENYVAPTEGVEGDPGAEGGESQRQGRPDRPVADDRPPRDPEYGEGIIEISGKGKGFGFLREAVRNYNQSPADVFVTPEIIRKYNLKDGMKIYGETRRGNRGPQLYKLIHINGENPEKYRKAPAFEELTVINPMERIRLETVPERYTTRVMDMVTPIGKGQRGLIVAPPRTGKTTMLQHIAEAITVNYPDMPLILMLIDERPEEVTELRRALPKAEVIASSNDSDPRAHLRTATLGIERAKRLVEGGHDVFMLLDSITRMGRAFNNAMHPGGKTGSGGIDSKAMEIPRKIFAAARNTEEAGSLTIIATALVDTGSKGDEYIFQEFKGTGNMEVVLDRKISDQLIFPAIDIFQSGTRREELILPPFMLDKINTIRRGLAGSKPIDAISRLLMFLRRFPTNFELLSEIPG